MIARRDFISLAAMAVFSVSVYAQATSPIGARRRQASHLRQAKVDNDACCDACGQRVDLGGYNWRILGDRSLVHYSGPYGLSCWVLRQRQVAEEP